MANDTDLSDDSLTELAPERVALLAWAGAALAEAQRLELAICTYLVINDPSYDPNTEPDVIAERFDVLRHRTLGNLLSEMYSISAATTEVRRDFDALNRERIELAHHLFVRLTSVAMAQADEGRGHLIQQLRSKAAEFNAAAEMVFKSALKGAERFGTDPRLIYEHARQVGAGEADLSSRADALIGLERTFTPAKLDQMALRLGVDPTESAGSP